MGRVGPHQVLIILKDHAFQKVSLAVVTNPGVTLYTSAPTVSFSGGSGTGAAATAIIENGKVIAITITNQGNNYTSYPTITLSGGGGTGATANAFVDALDISNKAVLMDYADEVPQSLGLTLNSLNGLFHTRGPIIKKRDRIYVQIIEKNGHITEDVFHVRRKKRRNIPGFGMGMTLVCPHQTENIWKHTVSFKQRGQRISGNRALEIIIGDINNNLGSKDPSIEIPTFDPAKKIGNRFDINTSNNYFFDAEKVDGATQELIDVELQPVEGGGSREPIYVRLKSKYDHSTGEFLDECYLQAFEQGFQKAAASSDFTSTPNTTLQHLGINSTFKPDILSMDSNEDPEEATNLVVICNKNAGSYPNSLEKWNAANDVFNSARDFSLIPTYKPGNLVKFDNKVFEAKIISTGVVPTNIIFWVERLFEIPIDYSNTTTFGKHDLVKFQGIAYKSLASGNTGNDPGISPDKWIRINFAPVADYSKLTKGKAQYWINALCGAIHATTIPSPFHNEVGRTFIVDPNAYIEDDFHPRTVVDQRITDPANISLSLLVDGKIPDAFRVLAISNVGTAAGTGDFTGNDINGFPFAGNIIEFFDDNNDGIGVWKVFKSKVAGDDQEVIDWFNGDPWVKNPCTGIGAFVNETGACLIGPLSLSHPRQTTWQKGSYGISELFIPLLFPAGPRAIWFTNKPFECMHEIKFDTENGRIDCGNEKLLDIDVDGNSAVFIKTAPLAGGAYSAFIGFNIHSRWPYKSSAANEPFGAVSAGEVINLPTTDLNNMDLTSRSKSDWFGPGAEEYFPFQSISGWLNLAVKSASVVSFDELKGNYTIGIWMVDRRDEVMTLEYTHKRNFKTLPMQGLLSKLKVFQGVPGNSLFGLQAKNPDGISAFNPAEFLRGGIYTKDSFDAQGRYQSAILGTLFGELTGSPFAGKTEIKMSIDQYHFKKPLVVTNIDEPNNKPEVNISPLKIQKQSISGYADAKQYVLGLESFLRPDRTELVIEQRISKKVEFGDSIYIEDTRMINEADDGKPNTLKQVVNSVIFSMSKTKVGAAGLRKFLRTVNRVYN